MPWRRNRLEALRRSLAAWIAATAKLHGLEVLSFNMADFRPMGILAAIYWRDSLEKRRIDFVDWHTFGVGAPMPDWRSGWRKCVSTPGDLPKVRRGPFSSRKRYAAGSTIDGLCFFRRLDCRDSCAHLESLRNMGPRSNQHVDTSDRQLRTVPENEGVDSTVTATNVQHGIGFFRDSVGNFSPENTGAP